MTANAWDELSDASALFEAVPDGAATERRLIHLAVACSWLPPQRMADDSARMLDAMQHYADGDITREQMDDLFEQEAVVDGAGFDVFGRSDARLYLAGALDAGTPSEAVAAALRCVFGNPFRLVAFGPSWRTLSAEALAASIYTARAFDQLPVLADALEDAGCDAAELLAHLRGPGPHVRGCWALDLVLGKD